MKTYKTVFIQPNRFPGDTISSEKIDKELNHYAKDGWVLHSISAIDSNCGFTFVCVFEK